MSNLDLTISDIFYGDTTVLKIMRGDERKWPPLFNVTTILSNITSDAPANVIAGDSITINLTTPTGYSITSCTVIMGGVDISSTAYNNGIVYIASVTGDVSITAAAEQVLPYDAVVEYLQSDGTAYIDTGIKVTPTTTFNFSMYVATPNKYVSLFGGRSGYQNNAMYFDNDSRTSGNAVSLYNFGNKTVNQNKLPAGLYSFNNTSNPRIAYVNSQNYPASSTYSFSPTNVNFYIFCMNNNGTAVNQATDSRFLSGKLYSNGTLVRDYIAVRKNGVGYLYDKVSGELFGNANSTGAFTYGNDV